MQKPPDGMAIAESLYGFEESDKTDSKISDPSEISKPESAYEREKRMLHRYPLSADEIQEDRKKAARRCRI